MEEVIGRLVVVTAEVEASVKEARLPKDGLVGREGLFGVEPPRRVPGEVDTESTVSTAGQEVWNEEPDIIRDTVGGTSVLSTT